MKKDTYRDPAALEKALDKILNEESYERKQKIINKMADDMELFQTADMELLQDYVKRELGKKVSALSISLSIRNRKESLVLSIAKQMVNTLCIVFRLKRSAK